MVDLVKIVKELRRRNVFRVGAGYLVLAWLIVQVADLVLDTYAAPVWVMRFIIAGVGIGFPITLGLAWIFEVTTAGVKRTEDAVPGELNDSRTGRQIDIAIIGVLVAALVTSLYVNITSRPGETDARISGEPSLAITRFTNLAGDDDQIALGISEDLLDRISGIVGVTIISTAVIMEDAQKVSGDTPIADYILHGSVRKLSDTFRLVARLTETDTGKLIWSDDFEGEIDNMPDEQRRIASLLGSSVIGVVRYVALNGSDQLNAQAVEYYATGQDAGSAARTVEDYQIARELFLKSLTVQADFSPSMLALCRVSINIYTRTVDPQYFDDVETYCNAALEGEPTSVQARESLGEFYNKQGEYQRAEAVLESAEELFPQYEPIQYQLAIAKENLGKIDEAEEGFRRSTVLEPESRWTYLAYGNFLVRYQRYDEAIAQFEKVTELFPDWFIGFASVGAAYMESGKPVLALEYLEESLRLNENDRTYFNVGQAYHSLEDNVNSAAAFRKAVELNPENFRAQIELAEIYESTGQLEQAQKALSEAKIVVIDLVTINPTNAYFFSHLAILHVQTGQPDDALLAIDRALELAPGNPRVRFNAGMMFYASGDMDRALSEMRTALRQGYPIGQFGSSDVPPEIFEDPIIQELLAEIEAGI